MKWRSFIFPALLIISIASCKKDHSTETTTVAASTMLNVAYGADAQQRIDVYLPANRTTATTKVMVFTAWRFMDRWR